LFTGFMIQTSDLRRTSACYTSRKQICEFDTALTISHPIIRRIKEVPHFPRILRAVYFDWRAGLDTGKVLRFFLIPTGIRNLWILPKTKP
jgi:hypothetical protein